MPWTVFNHMRDTAGQRASALAFHSRLYNWSLRGSVPDRLVVRPVDPWQGNVQAGKRLCEGYLRLGDDEIDLQDDCWDIEGVDESWMLYMHSFTWMRDLRALSNVGTASKDREYCRVFVRLMIESWIERYSRWDDLAWQPDVLGERIAMWISQFEFYGNDGVLGDEAEVFQDLFFDSLARQSRHLSRVLSAGDFKDDSAGLGVFKAAKGLLYAGIALEGHELWIEQALRTLLDAIDKQILGDGAHISRSPDILLRVLQVLLDVRGALSASAYPLPEGIQHAIDRMGPALRFFRYNDKKFAMFNGVQKGCPDFIDAVLAQIGAKGKPHQSLPCGGYERISAGRTLLMFDCGAPPPAPYDCLSHAGPLSFEMSYAKERLFVNCGTHYADEEWRDALRGTAAHNTLGIDHRNAYEIQKNNGIGRKATRIKVQRQDSEQGYLLDASHDGYVPLNGMTHRRRLYVSANGHDLRGEDILTACAEPQKSLGVAVRFHLHPHVKVSLINEGQEALLRLPSGIGWRFKHGAGFLALEDSLYLSQGVMPRSTKQLAIYGQVHEIKSVIKWVLKKEG